MFEPILELVGDVLAIIRAPSTAARVDAALALAQKLAAKTETVIDDALVSYVQNNQQVKQIIVDLVDRYLARANVGQVEALSLGAFTTDEVVMVEAQGLDPFKLMEIIRLIIDIINRVRE